jgi:polar amino acid transport system substrate-binding protein
MFEIRSSWLCKCVQGVPTLPLVAVAKDQTGLRDSLRDALERVMRSGAYAEVLQRWGVPSGALETATINAGGGAAIAG